jgi:ABC-type branched-subunit amino acid transport system substrate-binding protein
MNQWHKDVWVGVVQMVSAVRTACARRLAASTAVLALILAACGTPATPSAPAGGAAEATAPAAPAATAAPAGGAATSGGAVTGVTDSEIVIGSWGPQDGPAGAYGVIDRTIAAYFKMVNEQGGINGRQIKFVYENDSYQPAKTVAAVKKLAEEDKVFALVAGLGTPNNLAVMEYLVQNQIPHFAPATGSTAMSQPLKKNVFALQVNYRIEATLLTRYAIDTLKSQKIAVFYQNDAFGKEGFDSVNAVLKERGMDEATGVTYETSDTNYSSQALKLQTSGADTVVIWAVPKPGGGIIAEMDKIGFKPKLLASAVINDPAIFQLAGPGIEGLLTTAWLPDFRDTSNPKIAAYQEFMKKYLPDEQIGGFSLSGYTQAQFMAEALRRAGKDLTRESFIQTLEGISSYTDGVLPDVGYGPEDRQGSESIYFQQAQGGAFAKISDWISLK